MWKALDPSTGQGGPQGIYGNGGIFNGFSCDREQGEQEELSPETTPGRGGGCNDTGVMSPVGEQVVSQPQE